MTEEQVATAIAVLTAYAAGTLRTDQCDALDEAIVKAYNAWVASLEFELEDEPGQSARDMTGSMEWLESQDRD